MPTIKHSIAIAAPPEKVFPLLSSGEGFSQWWAADVTRDAASGLVKLGFFNRATVYELKSLRNNAPREVEWLCQSGQEWSGTRLVFQLSPDKNGSLLRFSHADWKAETDYFVSCTTTWGGLMFRIKAAAEGKSPGPLFSANGMAY